MLKVVSKSFHKTLREVVEEKKDSQHYKDHKENVIFELNHLELHGLDEYLFTMYKRGIKSDENPNNSHIAYMLGITPVAPKGRIKTKGGTTPDIDTDFYDSKRQLVKEYLKSKYGSDKVANIGTFGVSKCKGLFKDLARIWELPFEESNAISKMLPDDPDASIKGILTRKNEKGDFEFPELIALAEKNETIARIFEYADHIEGSIRNIGVHASGVALTSVPVTEIVPLFESKGEAVTQYDGTTLEKMGVIKFDILGLKTLTVISNTLDLIKSKYKKDIDLYKIDLTDEKVFKLFDSGDLLGIFQVEGSDLTNFAKRCKPRNIEELSAIIALYRPGPMGMGALDMYLKRINNRNQEWQFEIPEFTHIFKDTYGLLVYQEQLMRLSREMCGFTDIEADDLRKAVGKKDRELLLKQKDKFVNGAVNHTGQDKDRITKLFDSMEEFARYCFNLSHSICYAFLTYQTAWLKTYYKKEYIASLISCEDDPDQKSLYIENARFNKIKVTAPDINRSVLDFTVGEDESILFGFSSVKGIGDKAAEKILELQPFNSLADFLIRTQIAKGINKKVIEALLYCGALDCFGYTKSAILSGFSAFQFDFVQAYAKGDEQEVIKEFLLKEDQYFDNSMPELSFLSVLDKEKELLGIYLSASPFSFVRNSVKYKNLVSFSKIENTFDEYILALCKIEKVKRSKTKAGNTMYFIDCMDELNQTKGFAIFNDQLCELIDQLIEQKSTYIVLKIIVKKNKDGKLSTKVVDLVDLTKELNENIRKIEYKNAIRSVSLFFEGIPSTVRFKSIHNIITEHQKADSNENNCKVNLIVKLQDNKRVHIGCLKVSKIDVNFLRAFSQVKDVYLTRDNI